MTYPLPSWLLGIIGIGVLMYGVMPLLIWRTMKLSATPRFEPVALERLPSVAASYLQETAQYLGGQGFTLVDNLAATGLVANVTPILAFFVNRATGDKALATVVYTTTQADFRVSARYLEYSTRFRDGTVVQTSNNDKLGSFKPVPTTTKAQVPSVQDPHRLYRIHCEVMERRRANAEKEMPTPGTEVAWLCEAMIKDFNEQVAFGRLYLDAQSQYYRPTLTGAYLMTWMELWPVKAIRLAQMRVRANALLRSLRYA